MTIPMKLEDVVAKLGEANGVIERMRTDRVIAKGREAALREELARYKSLFGQAQKAIDRLNELHPKRMGELAKRLTGAEQRAAALESAAREMLRIAGIANQGSSAYNRAIINLNAALKPAAGDHRD